MFLKAGDTCFAELNKKKKKNLKNISYIQKAFDKMLSYK